MIEADFEEEFENARKLIARMRFTLGLAGLWPLERAYIRSTIWIIYYGFLICLEFTDLFTSSGNLESMIINLMEISFLFMIFFGMVVIRYSKGIRQLIILIETTMQPNYYDCAEERIIFLHYIKSVIMFYKISSYFFGISNAFYYLKPSIEFIISYRSSTNQTIILQTPSRIHFYHRSNTNIQNGILYLFIAPALYTGLFRPTIISLLMMLIFTTCSELAILSFRVQQCTPNENNNLTFRKIVEKHTDIISMSYSIEEIFSYLLLFELAIMTILLGLNVYNGILNYESADKFALINMSILGITTIMVIFGNCLIGQYLITESINLHTSFAKCLWYEMPTTHRKSLLICMNCSAKPLCLTAGKIYTFSLSGFSSVLKTSMAYVSMLRSMTDNE